MFLGCRLYACVDTADRRFFPFVQDRRDYADDSLLYFRSERKTVSITRTVLIFFYASRMCRYVNRLYRFCRDANIEHFSFRQCVQRENASLYATDDISGLLF